MFLAALIGLCIGAPASAADAHHLFWTVPGKHNTVYLLGSVHVLKPDDSELPAEALHAYQVSPSLVMELDLNSLTTDKVMTATLAQAQLPEGQSLAATLGPDVYERLRTQAAPLGLDPAFMSHFQPWFVALTLEQLGLARAGYRADSGVDMQLAHQAQNDRKAIIGLETAEEQLALFSQMSLPQQRQFLQYTLDDLEELPMELDELVEAWKHGDSARLEKLMHEGYDKFPQLLNAMLTDRNRKWVPRIAVMLNDDHDYLIVVGALHLVGHEGVIELLARQGYHPVQH